MRQIIDAIPWKPRFCVYETTLRCNMRCRHCGSAAGRARPDELTPEEARKLLNELCDLGLERLTLSGGEPLLREDWPDMARLLRDRGVAVTMISNGYMFDLAAARTSRDVGLRTVGFSIDGDEESHTYVRRIKDSYARIMQAIEFCNEVGQPFSVVTHLSKRTIPRLFALLEVLLEKKPNCWQIQLGSPMGNMPREDVVDDDDLVSLTGLFEEIYRRTEGKFRVYAGDCVGYYDPLEQVHRKENRFGFWTGCMAGIQGIGIESNGNVRGCLSIQATDVVEGNARLTPLREIWTRPDAFAYNRRFEPSMLGGFCAECEYGDICRAGCKSMAYATTGNPHDNPMCIHRVRVQRGIEPRRPRSSLGGLAEPAARAPSEEPPGRGVNETRC